jgi:hypothetical protein
MVSIPSRISNRICHCAAALAVLMLLTKIILGGKYYQEVGDAEVKVLSSVKLERKYKPKIFTLFNSSDTDADFMKVENFPPKDPRVLHFLRKKRIFPPELRKGFQER